MKDLQVELMVAVSKKDWELLCETALRLENLVLDRERRAQGETSSPRWWTGPCLRCDLFGPTSR